MGIPWEKWEAAMIVGLRWLWVPLKYSCVHISKKWILYWRNGTAYPVFKLCFRDFNFNLTFLTLTHRTDTLYFHPVLILLCYSPFFFNPFSSFSNPLSHSLPLHSFPFSFSSHPSSSSSFPLFPSSDVEVTGKPFFIVSSFYHRWLFGWEGCRFYGWAGFFFGCGSLITMTMVSLDRYLKICHLRYGMSGSEWIKYLKPLGVSQLLTSDMVFGL